MKLKRAAFYVLGIIAMYLVISSAIIQLGNQLNENHNSRTISLIERLAK